MLQWFAVEDAKTAGGTDAHQDNTSEDNVSYKSEVASFFLCCELFLNSGGQTCSHGLSSKMKLRTT